MLRNIGSTLQELNERIEKSRERYTKQFSDMNSAVTGFKKTEELLTNFRGLESFIETVKSKQLQIKSRDWCSLRYVAKMSTSVCVASDHPEGASTAFQNDKRIDRL